MYICGGLRGKAPSAQNQPHKTIEQRGGTPAIILGSLERRGGRLTLLAHFNAFRWDFELILAHLSDLRLMCSK